MIDSFLQDVRPCFTAVLFMAVEPDCKRCVCAVLQMPEEHGSEDGQDAPSSVLHELEQVRTMGNDCDGDGWVFGSDSKAISWQQASAHLLGLPWLTRLRAFLRQFFHTSASVGNAMHGHNIVGRGV